MEERLQLVSFADDAQLHKLVVDELMRLARSSPEYWAQTHLALVACCSHAAALGAKALVFQRRVQDPDFLAEYAAYYSRQFTEVSRNCVRVHFFSRSPSAGVDVLAYLDSEGLPKEYLGFITLRPIARTPVGASVLKPVSGAGFVRCLERFPVRIGGVHFEVFGTPFMQQDNAVGACAQASIWMALRTLQKREGDRSHNPAQITGAATRYSITGRILPNRSGLTQPQIVEAIRAAGYSPHAITFARGRNPFGLGSKLTPDEVNRARRVIHAYVDSELPVLLILYTATSAHAIVVVGHTFDGTPSQLNEISLSLRRCGAVKLAHAASWVPNFIVHNDNSGAYLKLESQATNSAYALEQTYSAIPLLPSDVFVTGEEALEFGLATWSEILEEFPADTLNDVASVSSKIAIRLLLLEKRKIRSWAARAAIAPEVARELRLIDLPRRAWVLEFHLKAVYGQHSAENIASLVGFILLDPTADTSVAALLVAYFNLPAFTEFSSGSLIVCTSGALAATQIAATPAVQPFRDLDDHG
jgi:hypothetical protein